MEQSSQAFRQNVVQALHDARLDQALDRTTRYLTGRRSGMLKAFPVYEQAREQGQAIKNHTLEHLDYYLELFEQNAIASGAQVHWADTAQAACDTVVQICKAAKARTVTKSKSMLGEEVGINEALAAAGLERVETDLGEHIIQLADEPPSHIVMPAMHKTHEEVRTLFEKHHQGPHEFKDIRDLVYSARRQIRDRYFEADVGISGANFLIAETGSTVTVTNEGNAELTTALPRVHIVTVGIEKVVPTLEDATLLLRLLARAALGTELTQYTTFYNGPRREGDQDGPEEFHIVLVDNGRSELLGNQYREMLRCIRCGACMNVCPVYGAVGGHAYGWVYPGPMGAILTPAITGLEKAPDLPNACTLNGRCAQVCPVKIPLNDLLRKLRAEAWRRDLVDGYTRWGLKLWAMAARRPRLYQALSRMGVAVLGALGGKRGYFSWLPLAGGWTRHRDFAAPPGKTFQQLWAERQRERGHE